MPVSPASLSRFRFLASLPASARQALARRAHPCRVPAQTILFREGDPPDNFYLIVQGQVEIFSPGEQTENRLNLLGDGAWFGELALIDGQPRSGSARTLSPAHLITLDHAAFRSLITTYPQAFYAIISKTQQLLRDRDRAYEIEMETRIHQLQELYQTSLYITRHLERGEALSAIRAHAIDLLQASGGDIYFYNATTDRLTAAPPASPQCPTYAPGKGIVGRAFQLGQLQRQPPRHTRYELAAPIKLNDAYGVENTLGVLTVHRPRRAAPFQPADETLLDLFAAQAAIVIENAELTQARLAKERMETELNDARRVQNQLIPTSPPRVPGYQIAALWHPAKQVSGDYYDLFSLSDGRLALIIGDVSGKGLNAALFMTNARSILRASALAGGDPSDILTRANDTLVRDSAEGMFVTLFLAVLEPRAHRLTYSNAGHNLPLLRRAATGKLEELPGGNLALGILPGIQFHGGELTFAPGDLLLMYTDGVTEAMASNETLFGEDRMRAVLTKHKNKTAPRLIRELDDAVRAFTGAEPQSDDITVLAICRV